VYEESQEGVSVDEGLPPGILSLDTRELLLVGFTPRPLCARETDILCRWAEGSAYDLWGTDRRISFFHTESEARDVQFSLCVPTIGPTCAFALLSAENVDMFPDKMEI